jgi:hypothetical protein
LVTASLLLAASLLTARGDTVPRDAIDREIAAMVRIDTVAGPSGPTRTVGFDVETGHTGVLLGPFLRRHGRIVSYLADHTPGAEFRLVSATDDPLAVRDSIVTALRTNTEFTDRLLQVLTRFWTPSGRTVARLGALPHATHVPAETLNRIGARFFYPDRMSATGDTMFTHICAGINGISDLPERVDPLVEAFVFVAVNSALFGRSTTPLMRAFEHAFARAKATSFSKDPATRILRAQGAMWAQMERSPAMTAAIAAAYRRHGAILPFQLARHAGRR